MSTTNRRSRGCAGPSSPARPCSSRGFALVITLLLLALLLLAVLALSALTRISTEISAASLRQTQARQNALLGLEIALGELQKHTGPDDRVTAMAGVTGLAANAGNTTRHWCGVWDGGGNFVTWLVSGAGETPSASIQGALTQVSLVDRGTVGAAAANSEPVAVGKLELRTIDPVTGQARAEGTYAYWVGDEGVKVSAFSPGAKLAMAGVSPVLASNPSTSATAKLRAALATYASKLPRVLSYEQLRLLPTPATSALTPSILQDSFHHTTLSAWCLLPASSGIEQRSGTFNLNTNSVIAWRGILETYNVSAVVNSLSLLPASVMGTSATTSAPGKLATNLPSAAAAGKSVNGPFTTVAGFAGSGLLVAALAGSGVTPSQFITGIGPLLTTRSDTFRLRAYGEALNPADATQVEARAYCEALVQRTSEAASGGAGHRYATVYFRWLGPDDI